MDECTMTWLQQSQERLERFRRGDRQILAQIYQIYGPKVMQRLALAVDFDQGPYELDDLVQETMLRAFSAALRKKYDGLRPYLPFLLGIALRIRYEHRCKQQRWAAMQRRVDQYTNVAQREQQHVLPPDSLVMQEQLQQLYQRFVAGLSELDRTVLKSRFVEELPRRQVRANVQLSPMQLRTREKSLKRRLYRELVAAGCGRRRGRGIGLGADRLGVMPHPA